MATKVVTKVIEETTPTTPDATKLDDAAQLLLAMLEERDNFLIQQTCEGQQLRPWMYIVGILRRALDTGDHTLPAVDPMWRTWGAWTSKVIPDMVCPVCSKLFTPRWQGQIYDTNECGAAAGRAAMEASRVSRSVLPGVGDEEATQCKSTIGREPSGVPTIQEAIRDAGAALEAAVGKQASPGTMERLTQV